MGAVRAVVVPSTGGHYPLLHFNDVVLAKMELVGEGKWILMATVTLHNSDRDWQFATAKLLHDRNLVIHQETKWASGESDPICVHLQVGYITAGDETITLECNTFKGRAENGSLIALKVDDIQFQ